MRKPLRLALVPILVLAGALLAPPPALAAKAQDAAAAQAVDELTPEQRKQKAKEDRIAEYLRKKEEENLQRQQAREAEALELEQKQIEEAAAAEATAAATATATAAETAVPGAAVEVPKKSALPKDLARAQERVRQSSIAADSTVQNIMTLIDQQQASPQQLAAFGNFVSDAGLNREAVEYYRVAVRLEATDPVLWVNLGTLYRKLGELSSAESAYGKALSLQPNYALAHYNIGAIYDERDKYQQAIESYKVALRLDPNLGNPEYNPQAVGNDLLPTVKLMLYEETVGAAGLPLVDFSEGEPPTETP